MRRTNPAIWGIPPRNFGKLHMSFKNAAGWVVDYDAKTIAWPEVYGDKVFPLPDVSRDSQGYFGVSYLTSQAASRTVSDGFRKVWAEAEEGRKAKDAPKSCVPASDSPEYVAALLEARKALFDKNVEGYEVGERAGSADPLTEAIDACGRLWLQGVATTYGWYTLPAKKKVARDEDPYADPKGRYATFGDALAAFVASDAVVNEKLVGKDAKGKPWPFKIAKGATVHDAIVAEATRRVDEANAAKGGVALGGDGSDVDF